jgi:hypothetical protein
MTAPVGRDVKRTFSAVGRLRTGLPGQCTLKAEGQQFANFRNACALVELLLIRGHRRKMNQKLGLSSLLVTVTTASNGVGHART